METVPASEITCLYHHNWYDGPIDGACVWRGERFYFVMRDETDDRHRVFHLCRLTPDEWAAEDARAALFRECVGDHLDCTEDKRYGQTRPREMRKRYYEAYPPDRDDRIITTLNEREAVAQFTD